MEPHWPHRADRPSRPVARQRQRRLHRGPGLIGNAVHPRPDLKRKQEMRNITPFMIAAALIVSGPAFAQENEVANAPADVTATDPLAADANAVVDPLATNDMGAVPVTDPAADPLAADPMYGE